MFDSLESRRDQSMSRKSALTFYAVYFVLGLIGVFAGLWKHKMFGIVPFSIATTLAGLWFVLTKVDTEGGAQRKHTWRITVLLMLTLIPTLVRDLLR